MYLLRLECFLNDPCVCVRAHYLLQHITSAVQASPEMPCDLLREYSPYKVSKTNANPS